MAIPRTSLLDLPLPVTGSLSGDWGAATNNGLTEYLDIAVAGSLVLNTDADVTLTSTDGDENGTNIGSTTAQYAILRWTATGSTTRNITVPAKSKTYIVINATGGTQSIVLRGAGPTTGVTIVSGERAFVAWNGSDFVKVGGAAGGTNTQVQYNNNGVFGGSADLTWDGSTLATTGLTASGAVTLSATTQNIALGTSQVGGTWTAGGASQTGAITLDQSTKTHTLNIGTGATENALTKTINLGTAGVSGSTTAINIGSAVSGATTNVTLNGTVQPGVVISGSSSGDALRITQTGTGNALLVEDSSNPDSTPFVVTAAGDVGIGTSSPVAKLQVSNAGAEGLEVAPTTGIVRLTAYNRSGGAYTSLALIGTGGTTQTIGSTGIDFNSQMLLDSSGNLGLGVTPSAWGGLKGLQNGRASLAGQSSEGAWLTNNAYYNGTNWVYMTSSQASMYQQLSGVQSWHVAASGTAGNAISFTQAMTLDASGNLVVGGTSASNRLDIQAAVTGTYSSSTQQIVARLYNAPASLGSGTNSAFLSLQTSTDGGNSNPIARIGVVAESYGSNNGAFVVATRDGSGITERARITSGGDFLVKGAGTAGSTDAFQVSGSAPADAARIDSSGNFLVGTTSSSATTNGFKVNFGQGATIPSVSVAGASSANTEVNYTMYSTSAAAYRFYVGYGGTIYATSTTITAISDQRLKENIQDIDVGLDAVMALKPRKFDWKEGKGKDKKGDRGWIAQEFEQVFPDMIATWKDEPPEGEEPYKAVNADLIPVLVKAIQELKADLDATKAELAALKGTQP